MFITTILFLIGFYILLKGSDLIIDGSSALARRLGISSWVIGLIIVGIGTSIPEFSITMVANFSGRESMALGTIIGSSTLNILFIIGISALIFPLTFKRGWIERDLIWNIFAVFVTVFFALYSFLGDGSFGISRIEGIIMLSLFILWAYLSIKRPDDTEVEERLLKAFALPTIIIMILAGLAGILIGGNWVVDGAIAIAKDLGISEKLIGLTILGIGTSMPELFVCLVAAYKKRVSLAVGTIIGSNIFSFFMILGLASVSSPIIFPQILYTDIIVALASAILLLSLMFVGEKRTINRKKGAFLVVLYILYIVYLVMRG